MNWNLKLIYNTESEFNNDFDLVEEDIKALEQLKGKLSSYDGFNSYVLYNVRLSKRISKLYTYAMMQHDLNQKDIEKSEIYSKVYSKYNEVVSRLSWIDPELLSIGEEKLLSFCDTEELKANIFEIKNLFRMNKYIKDEKTEAIMANYNNALGIYNKLYSNLVVVDNQSRKVKISTGETLKISSSNFTYYLGILENAKDRKKVFEAVYKHYDLHKSTLAGIYNGIMQSELALCKNRGYDSILDSKLYQNNIDKDVYLTLLDTAKLNTEPLKKYLNLRKNYFNLDKLHTYDRFLSFSKIDKEYSYSKAKEMVLEACKTMGEDFYNKACKVLEDGRVSVEMKEGKRTGAYSTSTYDEGPFILLNHSNCIDDAFTIAHEAGHSIHTLYSSSSQPYQTSHYVIFVAEIASTFNEQLLLDYMLKNSKDKNEKIVLLQQAIDGLIGTFYRQTLFADYEYQAHQLVENNIPVTYNSLSNIMIDLYKKYYDIDLNKEKYKSMVWAYIPHFFNSPFYVYQYATSFAASLAIYENVKNHTPNAMESYIELLKSGGMDYPVELVRKAGVDLTKKEAFLAVVHRLDELVGQLEALLK